MRYEEKARTKMINKIITECWKEMDGQKKGSKWEEERSRYYEGKGIKVNEVGRHCSGDLSLAETIAQVDRDAQTQELYDRIITGRYNKRYREIREDEREEYLGAEYRGRNQKMIARFRCGNEELENSYWKEERKRICRICGEEKETIEHLIKVCKGLDRVPNLMTRTVLRGGTEEAGWMRMVLER